MAVSNTKETKLYRLQLSKVSPPSSSSSSCSSSRKAVVPASMSSNSNSKRLRLPGACSPPAHALAFTPDGCRLVIAAAAGDIRVVDLGIDKAEAEREGGTAETERERGRDDAAGGLGLGLGLGGGRARLARLEHCFEEHVDGVKVKPGGGDEGSLPVSAITLSANGKWLVSASVSGVVYVFDLVGLRHHWTIPRYVCHVMAWHGMAGRAG